MSEDFDTTISAMEATGDYRVLRRLNTRRHITPPDGSKTRLGLMVDVETTGLDTATDEIIELAMVPFTYGQEDGRIFEIREPFQGLRQPSAPIPPEVVALTGITDEMVAGKSIDPDEVAQFAANADLVIAHNARFDRKMLERFCQTFTTKAWACSQSQVPWAEEGFGGAKLAYLLNDLGFFHGAHRAVDDCLATIEILSRPLLKSGVLAMTKLLESARRPTWRVWAERAPYDFKNLLKSRGYRWNDGDDGRPKAWYYDCSDEHLAEELAYLRAENYQHDADILTTKVSAFDRFSIRV